MTCFVNWRILVNVKNWRLREEGLFFLLLLLFVILFLCLCSLAQVTGLLTIVYTWTLLEECAGINPPFLFPYSTNPRYLPHSIPLPVKHEQNILKDSFITLFVPWAGISDGCPIPIPLSDLERRTVCCVSTFLHCFADLGLEAGVPGPPGHW